MGGWSCPSPTYFFPTIAPQWALIQKLTVPFTSSRASYRSKNEMKDISSQHSQLRTLDGGRCLDNNQIPFASSRITYPPNLLTLVHFVLTRKWNGDKLVWSLISCSKFLKIVAHLYAVDTCLTTIMTPSSFLLSICGELATLIIVGEVSFLSGTSVEHWLTDF